MTQELETKDGSVASAHPADAQGKPAVSGHQGKPKQHDKVTRMGTESIPRLITEFAVPSILGMLVNGAYNVIDSIFLGQAMGEIGLSTATVAMPIMTVFMAIAMLVGNGGNALAALRMGEGKPEEAERSLGNTVTLSLIASVVVAIAMFIPPCINALLGVSGATPEDWDYAMQFIRIISLGFIFQCIGMGVNNFIRTAGAPNRALGTMIIGAVACTVFNALFVLVMGMGVLASILPLIAGLLFAKYIGKSVKSADETGDSTETAKTYEELVASFGKLPGGFDALAPIIVPIVLMALGSIASMAGWTGVAFDLFNFLGKPIIALAVGTIFAVIQLAATKKLGEFYDLTNETLKVTGPILFVTAAGGVLGKVIATSDMVNFITEHATVLGSVGIFFPFLLAAILKSAQGSSTVAITTTAGIVAPLLGAIGMSTPAEIALVVMAIGAGAMTVSHANDSYFWVVTNFGQMTPEQGYKTQTMMTLVLGLASMVGIFILSLIF